MKVKSESEVAQSCLTLSDPMDCSPSGSPILGIFQARALEWGASAFSSLNREKTKFQSGTSKRLLLNKKTPGFLASEEKNSIRGQR